MPKERREPTPGNRSSQEIAERRRHKRFFEEVRVRYRDLEGNDPSRWGQTRDLSLGGLCLLSGKPLGVGSHLAIEIHIDNEPAPVLALGRVLRCGSDPEGGCASGIQFLWVGVEDRANLKRLAHYFRRKYGETGAAKPSDDPTT